MTQLKVTGSLVSIRTPAWKRSREFYSSLLGEPVREKPGRWSWFPLPGAGLVVWLAGGAGQPAAAGAGAGPPAESRVDVCLTVADLDVSHAALAAWTQVSPIQTASHGRECFLHDPDGNRVVIYQPHTASDGA